MQRIIGVAGLAGVVGASSAAHALSQGQIFGEASEEVQALVVALVVGMVAAIVITVRKVLPGAKLAGGSAFVSSLRAGGPLIGLLGAAINALGWCVAIANHGMPSMQVMAPGFAEAMFLILFGILAGVVAVICHWIIEARIDRSVLKL